MEKDWRGATGRSRPFCAQGKGTLRRDCSNVAHYIKDYYIALSSTPNRSQLSFDSAYIQTQHSTCLYLQERLPFLKEIVEEVRREVRRRAAVAFRGDDPENEWKRVVDRLLSESEKWIDNRVKTKNV